MDLLPVLGMVVALSMDAFAVSVGVGLSLPLHRARHVARFSLCIGLFHILMPLLGWCGGAFFEPLIDSFDHWLAFALLGLVGLHMIAQALGKEPRKREGDPTRGISLIFLGVATSVDAFGVGLTMGVLDVPLFVPAFAIGAGAALMTAMGMTLGKALGSLVGRLAEIAGGIILMGIGLKILLEGL